MYAPMNMATASHSKRVHPLAPRYRGDEIIELTALEQAARIADGTLTSRALTERYLARIHRFDPALCAFVSVLERAALREADRLDAMRAKGQLLGPLHGTVTAIKDHHLVRMTRTRIGSKAFDWLWTPVDDPFVKRVRDAGVVIVGKTTMSELGILPIVESPIMPPTRNPWNTAKTAGGSSGGAAAALAAGLLSVAPGSDGAGSIRIPSSLNGLVGLKPTRHLVPDRSDKIDTYGLATNGPMGRSIDDVAALLDALCDPSRKGHLSRSKERVRPLRVGLFLEPPVGDIDARIAAVVERAADVLRAAGHTVELRVSAKVELDDFVPVYQRFISRIPIYSPKRLGEFARWFWETGRTVPESKAASLVRSFEEKGRSEMEGLDVMLAPSVSVMPFDVGEFAHLPPAEVFRAVTPLGAFTALANVTGQPALSVPFATIDGMPVGVQLIGQRFEDATLLALGRVLEAS